MQLILFIGLQAVGKSTFYARQFADTHVRLNLDMLRTRHRERLLFEACLAAKQPTVIDNTNPTATERARYIGPARAAKFEVIGYYFAADVEACARRNEARRARRRVPAAGLFGTLGRLERPSLAEGFDMLHHVRSENGDFVIEAWRDEF
jgi:predicted kinase